MNKLKNVERLSKAELKLVFGGGNNNPLVGGGEVPCHSEPSCCNSQAWENWRTCVGPKYSLPFTCVICK